MCTEIISKLVFKKKTILQHDKSKTIQYLNEYDEKNLYYYIGTIKIIEKFFLNQRDRNLAGEFIGNIFFVCKQSKMVLDLWYLLRIFIFKLINNNNIRDNQLNLIIIYEEIQIVKAFDVHWVIKYKNN